MAIDLSENPLSVADILTTQTTGFVPNTPTLDYFKRGGEGTAL
jgi:hypothetical protein